MPGFILFFGDSNILFLLFFALLSTFIIYTNSSLHLLLTAELVWITLYALALSFGLLFDNLNLLSLTFFFLILSAVEFGVGLVLILLQHTLTRTLDLSSEDSNTYKYKLQRSRLFNLNRVAWKV